jgi:ATP-dependent RNA helicase RhlE
MNSFSQLALGEPLQRAVREAGYSTPTPIQVQAIPHLLQGRDLLGCAKTGTGKTAAFSLPILQRLADTPRRPAPRQPRVLVLAPTRELAAQVAESFVTYGAHLRLAVSVIYGGVGQGPQVSALVRGVDVLVACPGRLVDLMGQGHVRLDSVEMLVLDEADHMLDLGFLPDVKRILAAASRRKQTLLFSATMPPPIAKLAEGILRNPIKVVVTPPASTVELTTQHVMHLSRSEKASALTRILSDAAVERAIVFTRTKRGADRVAKRLNQDGVPAQAIHGNKSQNNRERTLDGFREGQLRVLVATDIAARGIDIDDISHVVNYELPNVPETYVHRIGRTGRAGATGVAISLCDEEEREFLRDIEKLTQRKLAVIERPAGGRTREPREARTSERVTERATGRATERQPERQAERRPARHDAPPRERSPRPAADRAPQRGAERNSERNSERSSERRPSRDERPRQDAPTSPRSPRTGRSLPTTRGFARPVAIATRPESAQRPSSTNARPSAARDDSDFGAGV